MKNLLIALLLWPSLALGAYLGNPTLSKHGGTQADLSAATGLPNFTSGVAANLPPGASGNCVQSNGSAWVANPCPTGGSGSSWSTSTENPQSGTSYSFSLTDPGKVVSTSNSSLTTLTIPSNATTAIPVGSIIQVTQQGAGAVAVEPASGVTLNSLNSFHNLSGQGAQGTLFKSAANLWYLWGQIADTFIQATGGTITTIGNIKLHTFTSGGNLVISSGSGSLGIFAVAGGGAGGYNIGGGGAGGGIINTTATYGPGTYTVVVGAGTLVAGSANPGSGGNSGGNSTFDGSTYIALGGAGGGSFNGTATGGNGGSGGGGGITASTGVSGGTGTAGQGFGGGSSGNNPGTTGLPAGGGGGAGGAGGNGGAISNTGGTGGLGLAHPITGTFYASGGGGGALATATGGSASAGGGGAGGAGGLGNGVSGTTNTGGGGGGGGNTANAGAGASGIVTLWYQWQ